MPLNAYAYSQNCPFMQLRHTTIIDESEYTGIRVFHVGSAMKSLNDKFNRVAYGINYLHNSGCFWMSFSFEVCIKVLRQVF